MGICKGNIYRKFTGAIYIEGNGIRVDFFIGIGKSLCNDGALDVIDIIYDDYIWRLNFVYIDIEEFWTFLGVHK